MSVTAFELNRPNSLIILDVRIAGPNGDTRVKLALDTGCTHTVVRPGYLKLIGCDPDNGRIDRMTTASGTEIVKQVVVRELTVLDSTVKNFRVLAQQLPLSLPIDGLIGLDVFRKLRKTISIDFAEKLILLK